MLRNIVAGAVILGMTSVASAAALNLTQGRPDVFSAFIAISYDANTHILTADGFTQNFQATFVSPLVNLNNRQWSLSAEVLNNGTITGVGSLSIFGDYGGTNVLLASANHLDQFGFSNGLLEFVFSGPGSGGSINSGQLPIGVILSDITLPFSSFNANFDNFETIDARSDSFLIPAPGAGVIGVCCLAVAARRRRR